MNRVKQLIEKWASGCNIPDAPADARNVAIALEKQAKLINNDEFKLSPSMKNLLEAVKNRGSFKI